MTTNNTGSDQGGGLLACPFCGERADWVEDDGSFDTPFGLVCEHAETCFLGVRMMAEWDHIIAAWNTRAHPPERIRELEEEGYRRGIEAAARIVEAYDTFSGDPSNDAVRDVMAVELADRIRSLSPNAGEG